MRSRAVSRRGWLLLPWLLLCLSWGLFFYLAPGTAWKNLSLTNFWPRLGLPLIRLLFYLGLGLFIGQLIESLGWTARLGAWVQPLVGWGRLGSDSAAAFTASFMSGLVANSMLMGAYQEGRLTRQELRLSYLLNNGLPTFFLHLPTTFFILAPLVGQAGVIYLGLNLVAAVGRSLVVLVYARWVLPSACPWSPLQSSSRSKSLKESLAAVWRKFQQRFLRLLSYTIPIYLFVYQLQQAGFFSWLRQQTAAWITVAFLPVEAASVVIFAVAAEFSSGIAAAGALLAAGALTVPQTVAALILGSVVATPIRAIRHQLPTHMGIFSPKLGLELLVASQTMRVVSLLLVSIPYIYWGT